MGLLTEHNLNYYIDEYKLEYYFETGTGQGECLDHSLRYPFKEYWTVDIDEELIENCYGRMQYYEKNINFLIGKSTEIIDEYVPNIPKESSTLFFLDAHFPGADFKKCTYEESIRKHGKDAFPLEEEVDLIFKHRDILRDVFIIDDFVLYQKDAEVEHVKNGHKWEYDWLQEELNLQTDSKFLYEKFEKTHDFKVDLRSQGYLIITPKKK